MLGDIRLQLIVITTIVLVSCKPDPELNRLKAAGDFFVGLFDTQSPSDPSKIQLQVSSTKDEAYSLCISSGSAVCKAEDEKVPLKKVSTIGDRFIHAASNDILPSGMSDYIVLDAAGLKVFRFKLKAIGETLDALTTGLATLDVRKLREELNFITNDKFQGRLSATKENDEVADWLIQQMKDLNIKPVFSSEYRQRFPLGVGPTGSGTSANIIGLIEGSDPVLKDEYIVIGAHMDHTGSLSRGYTCSRGSIAGDNICNGADDNGSGTIAVLNVAKALTASRASLKRSVLIMFFSGEEQGLIGSRYYVKNPVVPLNKHIFMINLDMVGYASSNGKAISALGSETSKTGSKILADLSKKYTEYKIKPIKEVDGGSDHAPFMNKGIPGIFYHTGVRNNRNYHTTSDHPDLIDYSGMHLASKLAFETVYAVSTVPKFEESASVMALAAGERPKFVSDLGATQGCHFLMNYTTSEN